MKSEIKFRKMNRNLLMLMHYYFEHQLKYCWNGLFRYFFNRFGHICCIYINNIKLFAKLMKSTKYMFYNHCLKGIKEILGFWSINNLSNYCNCLLHAPKKKKIGKSLSSPSNIKKKMNNLKKSHICLSCAPTK